jgi:DeoR family transcriptional regulator, fructose operon transcriptional repressor
MFIEERHNKIHDLIRKKGRIEVPELSILFQISEDTIRRDLKILEERGLIQRTHGGAILSEKVSHLLPYPDRVDLKTENKNTLAQKALTHVDDGDTLFLCGATTVARMVPMLSRFKNITVVTNSVMIAAECVRLGNGMKIYMIGGQLHQASASATGAETVEAIRRFSVDKVFMSICYATPHDGLTTPSIEESPIFHAILDIGREIYLLYSGEKHGIRSLSFIGPIKPEYHMIVDAEFSDSMREEFSDLISKGLRIE